jgi:hypothetical protein
MPARWGCRAWGTMNQGVTGEAFFVCSLINIICNYVNLESEDVTLSGIWQERTKSISEDALLKQESNLKQVLQTSPSATGSVEGCFRR